MPSHHTLTETERVANERIAGLDLDFRALAVASNLFRAANAVRNYMERNVLAQADLTWTAFIVLWVSWIWGEAETRTIAEDAGVSKATLSGVLNTLEGRGLVKRTRSAEDGRLVLVTLTPAGTKLIKKLFPQINKAEQVATARLGAAEQEAAAEYLRQLVLATTE